MGSSKGITLAEVAVAAFILGIVALGLIETISKLGLATNYSRELTVATGLAQEKMEQLKSNDFYNVVVTSSPAYDTNFTPMLSYDSVYYAPDNIVMGGTTYIRRIFVEKVDADASNNLVDQGYPHPDTGIKRVTVHVVWSRRGTWKKVVLSSVVEDPNRVTLDKRVYGTVADSVSGLPLQGVTVMDRRDPAWSSMTDAGGNFSYWCSGNSAVVRATKTSYNTYTSGSIPLPAYPGNQVNVGNISLVAISSRTVQGYAMHNGQLVISQVSAQWSALSNSEFVELYNPTTSTILISPGTLRLKFVDSSNSVGIATVSFLTSSVPSYGYYLILGSTWSTSLAPNGLQADATYYTNTLSTIGHIDHNNQAGVIVSDGQDNPLDSVGWGKSPPNPPPSAAVNAINASATGVNLPSQGGFLNQPGLQSGETLYRKAYSTSTAAAMLPPGGGDVGKGNAWNSWNTDVNGVDFVGNTSPYPRNSSSSHVPVSGTVWPGSYIFVDDTLMASARASTSTPNLGYFSLPVALGTWQMFMSSGALEGIVPTTVNAGAAPWTVNILSTNTTTMGFISGYTRQFGSTPFGPIVVQADPGGYQATSQSAGPDVGLYLLRVPAGENYVLTGNPNFADPNWNTAVATYQVSVSAGFLYDNINLDIWHQGAISGQVTISGTAQGLPNVVVVATGAFADGNSGVTDSNGNYVISGLRLVGNPYWVYPDLQTSQASTPIGRSVTATQGGNASGNNFQVTGAFQPITGSVTNSGSAIGTGVLIMASTVTLAGASPPALNFALRSGKPYYYQVFSDANGNYELDVPGGSTYNVVAWYTQTTTTTYKAATVVVPLTSGVSSSFSWP